MEVIKGGIQGQKLKKRLRVGDKLDTGQFGEVHTCIDELDLYR